MKAKNAGILNREIRGIRKQKIAGGKVTGL